MLSLLCVHLDVSKPIDLFSGAFALVFEAMIEQVNLMTGVHMNDSMMLLMLAAGLSGGSGRDAVGQD